MLAVDVEKRLGDFFLSARFQTGSGVTAVFGPSGAGKTTLVNMVSGLVAPDRGRITIDETVLFDSAERINLPPHGRRIGYVFQEGRLFPHLSVKHNLDYGRRMCGLPPDVPQCPIIVAALIVSNLARTSGTSWTWPCRSMASSRIGTSGRSRLPQIRSDASQTTISASRTASS